MASPSTPSNQIQVIGAGFGRTGTSSLKKALDILGYNTYHMTENFKHFHFTFWLRVSNSEFANREKKNNDNNGEASYHFDEIFKYDPREQYTATCDFPSSQYWEEQLKQYPDAKVILTKRANAEKWYQSCIDTIFRAMPCSPFCDTCIYWWTRLGVPHTNAYAFFQAVFERDVFHYNWSKENIIACYNEHNRLVEEKCPKDKLLVFDVTQGWAPLCEFLNKPIPENIPFPHANDTKEFQTLFRNVHIITAVILIGLPSAAAAIWWGANNNDTSFEGLVDTIASRLYQK